MKQETISLIRNLVGDRAKVTFERSAKSGLVTIAIAHLGKTMTFYLDKTTSRATPYAMANIVSKHFIKYRNEGK